MVGYCSVMARTIKRRKSVDIGPLLKHYLDQRMMRERTATEEDRDKKELMSALAEAGVETEEGHRRITLDDEYDYVDPKGYVKRVASILRQRRVSQSLDEDATMKLLAKKGLTTRCTRTIIVLDEDQVLAANYEGKITDRELAALYSESENFAFVMEFE